ncbi:Nucleoside-diphosphate-sugar epimerase [Lachnospiraceae bacterium G11]|nr:Nucleoside-diphosphate-sugar epimerase [Lachnospiraceae bacterium G11]
MKNVLVTGANGFVGAALCKELSLAGVNVIAVVRNEMSDVSKIEGIGHVRIVYSDMKDYSYLDSLLSGESIDAAYHLSWEGSAGPLRGEEKTQLENVQYSCDLLRACARLGCKRFIFASSIMIYEVEALVKTGKTLPINTIYATAKLTAGYMLKAIAARYGVEYNGGVISNIYGPGEDSPRLINSSLRKLLILGAHCSFTDGEQLYDFIYLTDAAKAFFDIGDKGKPNIDYYIGNADPRPLKEYLLEMGSVINCTHEIGLGELNFDGVSLSYDEIEINRLSEDTGFSCNVSFREGIKLTAEWIRKDNK